MTFQDVKNKLFRALSTALSIAALVLCIVYPAGGSTILTVVSAALVCSCLIK